MEIHNFKKSFFFFQAEDGIRGTSVTGVQTCALPISSTTSPSDQGDLGDATEAAAGKAEAVIGAPNREDRNVHREQGAQAPRAPCAEEQQQALQRCQKHATDMVQTQYFSHVSKSGTTVVPRI